MTNSHNTIRRNIKMTTSAIKAKTNRLKNGGPAASASPAIPIVTAHSSSIASSTNQYINNHNKKSQKQLSYSPPGGSMSSGSSTCSNSSTSSLGSINGSISGNGIKSSTGRRQPQQQQRNRKSQNSPLELMQTGDVGEFYYQRDNCNSKRNSNKVNTSSGSAQKLRDQPLRSPSVAFSATQSPATILAGGICNSNGYYMNTPTGSAVLNSGRKQRKSPLNFNNVISGKTSPTNPPLIHTALTHFAGSKCFDAPAPTALPKPPQHWTKLSKTEEKTTSSAGSNLHNVVRSSSAIVANKHALSSGLGHGIFRSSKRNLLDDFETHNLKLLLNVQS